MAAVTEGGSLAGTAVQELDGQFEAHRAGLVRLCASMVGTDDAVTSSRTRTWLRGSAWDPTITGLSAAGHLPSWRPILVDALPGG